MNRQIPFSIALAVSALVAGALMLAAVFSQPIEAQGVTSYVKDCPTASAYVEDTLLSATTTSATSTNISSGGSVSLACAKKATALFSRGGATGANTGSTNFRLQVSSDGGSTWQYFNRLIQNVATSTGAADYTVESITVPAGTSTVMAALDLKDFAFDRLRCIAVETTDGDHTCKVGIEY
jgi:hypothetical protein